MFDNSGRLVALGVILLLLAAVPSCTVIASYNAFQARDESVKQATHQLYSVYQKRADLVGNLVETVKGYAQHESSVFIGYAEARAKVGQLAPPANATPDDLQKFAQAQKEMSGVLGRLMLVAESTPQLKADASFRQMQKDLRDIETQATAARNRVIREIRAYNTNVRSFPSNLTAMLFGYGVKPQLEFEDIPSIKQTPKVDFGTKKG